MSKPVSLKIDGRDVKVLEGTNLIDAAESSGIHIPNLCYLKGVRGIGACRLCLVEIEGMKAPVIACTTKVKEGMNVTTDTEKIREMRKFVIDLILSMHPLDCMTCTKAGVCNLQQYAYDFELKESTFTRKKFGFSIDEANPFIKREPDYCILCGRCVRVCKEQGTNVLDFMGRGVGARVITAMDKPLQESECTFCGSCVDACPVNALLEADRWRKGREWEYTKINSVCLSCGNGCDITVSTKDGSIVKINVGTEDSSVERYICAIGRFGFDSITADSRITAPLKRIGNELKETTWDDALKIAAEKLKEAGKGAGIVSTGNILNQDAFVLGKLASQAVKTKNVDTTVSLYADEDSMKYSDSVDIDSADLIVAVGINPSQWERVLPALDAGIRKRVARGAKLIVINNPSESPYTPLWKRGAEGDFKGGEGGFASIANINIRGDEASALAQVAKALKELAVSGQQSGSQEIKTSETSPIEQVVALFVKAQNPVIFTAPSLFNASVNIKLVTRHLSLVTPKVVAVPLEANARGVVSMGLIAEGKSYKDMVSGGAKVLYVIGEIPVNQRPKGVDFLIVQGSHMTEIAKQADIVLPASALLESEGTIINYLGRVKDIIKAIEPAGSAKQHKDIFIALSKAMGNPIRESKIKTVLEVKAKAKFSPFEKREGLDINPNEFIESINKHVINHSRLLWLKETEKVAV